MTSAVIRAGGTLVNKVRSKINPRAVRRVDADKPGSGWLVVTVLCGPSDIATAELPAPLAKFGDQIEVRVRPAADSKGTELAARLRDPVPSGTAVSRLSGTDSQSDLRSALRQTKQLIEVKEVLVVDPTPHGERPPTPGGELLETWTKAARKAGVR